VGSLGPEVEEFCLKKNLMPSGFLITTTQLAVQLWNFDDHQDKKRLKCRLESQLVFSEIEAIRDCSYNKKQNILLLLHKNFSLTTVQLGKLEKRFQAMVVSVDDQATGPQLTQMNRYALP